MLARDEPASLAHLEPYLMEAVGPHFRRTGQLSPEDFWLILIWKANRAKNNERRRFEAIGKRTFAEAVCEVAGALHQSSSSQDRLKFLMASWQMKLPTASAVLTILYPDDFTVYDIRVCNQLGAFRALAGRSSSADLWDEYVKFVDAVRAGTPANLTLRQKDTPHVARDL